MDITVHDDIYQQTERDPWVFYERGKLGFIVITSDTAFIKSFPHMAAIALGKTTVLAFSNNNYKSDVRGKAFIKARPAIEKQLAEHQRKQQNFIGIVGMKGTLNIRSESPLPYRKTCDPRDWESYKRVCAEAGVLVLTPEH